MNTDAILASIERYVHLDKNEAAMFTSLLLPLRMKQHEFIEQSGEQSKYFIHVSSGCLMSYYTDNGGSDHVLQFATAGWWTGDLHSFTKQVPSIYSTRALADSEVLLLPKLHMDQLLGDAPKFEKYFRIIFQNSLITHQNRIIQSYSNTAEERYLSFRERYATLEQYVPLKYIASYLGITPEFLSKIRRKLMDRSV